ncbi:cell division protein ZapA [Immundisolibacter sp.]
MSKDTGGVAVRVLEREYVIAASGEQREAVLASADYLNERLRELRRGGRVVGNDRLLVLVALNVVNELLQERRAVQDQSAALERLSALEGRLTAALRTLEPTPHSG